MTSGLAETMQSEGIDKGFLVLSMGFTRNLPRDEWGPRMTRTALCSRTNGGNLEDFGWIPVHARHFTKDAI